MAGNRRQGSRGSFATREVGAVYGPQIAEYYAPLAEKYRRAMWRPWMPVAPDPHAPGFDRWLEQERKAKEVAPGPPPLGFPPPQSLFDRGDAHRFS